MSTSTAPAIAVGTWHVDPSHSSAGFSIKHMGIATVRGRFGEFGGALRVAEDGAIEISGSAEVASIDTRSEMRDDHLRSPDFFDAGTHPQITFRSTRVEPVDEDTYEVTGDLTIRGATREVVLTVEVEGSGTDMQGKERVALTAKGAVNRGDYGLTWNQTLAGGDVLVGDKVKLELDIAPVKESAG